MLTIDEAIKHCEEVAEAEERSAKLHQRPDRGIKGSGKRYLSCIKCASEHRQLAEWLKELKKYKEGIDQIKELTDDYKGWDNWDIVKGLQYALECLEVKTDDGDCD